MKKIALLTRDCAGINAAIRAVVRTAVYYGIEVLGVLKGYEGLIDGRFIALDRSSVSGIINQGGSILKASRSLRFKEIRFRETAIKNLKDNGIEGLVVIGGNGSLTGALRLSEEFRFPTIGVPATIDNDINGVELSIGSDTAVNVALDALDKIRDTAMSLERIFVVEVMGRNSGYIALQVALAGGCEEVLLPEREHDLFQMMDDIKSGNAAGKVSWIVIVAEGRAKAADIADLIRDKTDLETRVAVLGHIQRGGRPTALDRILAARLGSCAVEHLKGGKSGVCVHIENDREQILSLEEAVREKKIPIESRYRLIKILT